MKHIKSKELYNIEDSLIEFEDSGEISDTNASYIKTTIMLDFHIDDSIIGMKKLILLDKIISKLRKKYNYLFINDDNIYINKQNEGDNYINGSLVELVNKLFKNKLTGLNTYTGDTYRGIKHYGKAKNDISLQYKESDCTLYIGKCYIYNSLHKKYMLSMKDIINIMCEVIEKFFIDNHNLPIKKILTSSLPVDNKLKIETK